MSILKLKKETKAQKADICWCDDMSNNLKGYALRKTHNKSVLHHSAKKFKINMISAITNTGKSTFNLYDDSIKIDSFIEFCQKVIRSNNGKKVFLVVDNLRAHHAKLVKAWEKENSDKIKSFICLLITLINISTKITNKVQIKTIYRQIKHS